MLPRYHTTRFPIPNSFLLERCLRTYNNQRFRFALCAYVCSDRSWVTNALCSQENRTMLLCHVFISYRISLISNCLANHRRRSLPQVSEMSKCFAHLARRFVDVQVLRESWLIIMARGPLVQSYILLKYSMPVRSTGVYRVRVCQVSDDSTPPYLRKVIVINGVYYGCLLN